MTLQEKVLHLPPTEPAHIRAGIQARAQIKGITEAVATVELCLEMTEYFGLAGARIVEEAVGQSSEPIPNRLKF